LPARLLANRRANIHHRYQIEHGRPPAQLKLITNDRKKRDMKGIGGKTK